MTTRDISHMLRRYFRLFFPLPVTVPDELNVLIDDTPNVLIDDTPNRLTGL